VEGFGDIVFGFEKVRIVSIESNRLRLCDRWLMMGS